MPESKTPHDPTNRPDNLQDCHDLIKELFARIAELEKQLSRRNRAIFGRKSAKVDSCFWQMNFEQFRHSKFEQVFSS